MIAAGLKETLAHGWAAFIRDPAGFIEGLPQPLRGLGLAELAAFTWFAQACRPVVAASLVPDADGRAAWPLLDPRGLAFESRQGRALLLAFDADDHLLAAAEAWPGRPGRLRLRAAPHRVVVHDYGTGIDVGLASWKPWTVFRACRRRGDGMGAALRAAWPAQGRGLISPGSFGHPPSPDAYRRWRAQGERRGDSGRTGDSAPVFTVLVLAGPDVPSGGIRSTVAAIVAQRDVRWEAILVGTVADTPPGAEAWSRAPDLAEAVAKAGGDLVVVCPMGCMLEPDALIRFGEAFGDDEVMLAYSDEDLAGGDGEGADPFFKTAFDLRRLLEQDYIGAVFAMRAGLVRGAEGVGGDGLGRSLALGLDRGAVRHVPRVLWRRASRSDQARVPHAPPICARPSVTVIVPTKDRADLLEGCVAGLLQRTGYAGLEVCIVDNGSRGEPALALLERLERDPRVRVLRIDAPFNYPLLNNAAVDATSGEVLAFLNDDVLVIEPGWLDDMVALATQPDVGAVGAKLLYQDGRVQHAGVALGLGALGVAGHPLRGARGSAGGPGNMLDVRREVSAVTGACLVVERRKFQAVEGFDPRLAVAFNDVDLCLRLGERGWTSVWTPHARLIHFELASRGKDVAPEQVERLAGEAALMRMRWGARLVSDPYYHPALYLEGERWVMGERSRSDAPR